ncbi:hypothetical protein [Streptomyces sp. cmx-4-9]
MGNARFLRLPKPKLSDALDALDALPHRQPVRWDLSGCALSTTPA